MTVEVRGRPHDAVRRGREAPHHEVGDLVIERSWENAGRLAAALAQLAAVDATGAETPLTPEVLVGAGTAS